MDNPALVRLSQGADFSAADRARLDALIARPREILARADLVDRGQSPELLHILVGGYACRYKILPDGGRAIVGLMLPGDICDLHIKILGQMDHSLATISDCRVVAIPHDEIDAMLEGHPTIARAMWWSSLVDEGILRQWLANKGRKRADRQMMHLFCELYARLELVGLTHDHEFPFPLTQEELADTLGIAPVHAHRVLQTLRVKELVVTQGRRIRIPSFERAIAFAQFESDYLHLRYVPLTGP